MADGSITIDTKIDQSGLKKDLDEMASILERNAKSIESLYSKAADSIFSVEEKTKRLKTAYKEEIETLKQKFLITGQLTDEEKKRYDTAIAKLKELGVEGKKSTNSIGGAFARLRDIMQGPVAAINMLRNAFVSLGRSTIGQSQVIEDMTAAFTPLTGSMESATNMIEALNKEAASTPFQLETIGAAAKQLLPILGNDVKAVTDTFRMLGDTAGGNAQKLESITRGYSKAMLKGRVDMESLNMIAEAGVPIYTELAASMGVSVEQMMKLSSEGKITDDNLTAAFQRMTSEGGIFFNGMNIASQTLSGRMSTLQDNIKLAGAAIGNAFLPFVKQLVDRGIEIVSTFGEWAQESGNIERALQAIATVIIAATAGFVAYTVATNAAAIAAAALAIKQGALNAIMLANPAVTITAGIVTLTGALVAMGFAIRNARVQQEELNKAMFGQSELSETERQLAEVRKKIADAEKRAASASGFGGGAGAMAELLRLREQESALARVADGQRRTAEQNARDAAARERQLAAENAALAEQARLQAEKEAASLKEQARLKALAEQAEKFRQELSNIDAMVAAGVMSEEGALNRKIDLRKREVDLLIKSGIEGTRTAAEVKRGVDEQVAAIARYEARLKQLDLKKYYDKLSDQATVWRTDITEETRKTAESITSTFARVIRENAHEALTAMKRLSDGLAGALAEGNTFIGTAASDTLKKIGKVAEGIALAYSGDYVGAALAALDVLSIGFGMIKKAFQDFVAALIFIANFDPAEMYKSFEEFIDGLVGFFTEDIPQLPNYLKLAIDKINEVLGSLDVQKLASTLTSSLQSMAALILANAPTIISSFAYIMGAIIDSVIVALPEIIDAAVLVVKEFAKGITSVLPQIIQAATAIGIAVILGIVEVMPEIVGAIIELVPEFVKAFATMLPLILTSIVAAGLIGFFWRTFASMMADPVFVFEVGKAIVLGLIDGIVASFQLVVGTIKSLVDIIVNNFKKLFGIHSPSTVFADLGINLIKGLINGITNAGAKMWDSIKGVFNGIVDKIKQTFTNVVDPLKIFSGESQTTTPSAPSSGGGFVGSVVETASNVASAVVDTVSSAITTTVSAVSSAASSVGNFLGGALSKLKLWDVGSPYISADHIAMLHQGERVVPKTHNESMMAGETIMMAPGALAAIMAGLSSMAGGFGSGQASLSGAKSMQIIAKMDGRLDVDGREIGRIAFQYADEMTGFAYGN